MIMEEAMEFGKNVQAIWRGHVEKLVELEESLQGIKEDQKQITQEIKGFGLPAKELLAEAKLRRQKSETALKERWMRQSWALSLLNLPNYVSNMPQPAPELPDESRKMAKELSTRYLVLMDEISGIRDEMRSIYSQVKGMSLSVEATKKVVKFKLSPAKLADWREDSDILQAYLEALGL